GSASRRIGSCFSPEQRGNWRSGNWRSVMPNYDAIIIGTGQSGPALARRLVAAGRKVAIIERKLFGGTCVNTGCTPTKALVASAYAAHLARRAADFGVVVSSGVEVDSKALKARQRRIADESRENLERWLKGISGLTLIEGHARFIDRNAVDVSGETLKGNRIFINVGGRAAVPDLPGIRDVPYLTNSSILQLDRIPRHLVVMGGSYIGLEFAQIYSSRSVGLRSKATMRAPGEIEPGAWLLEIGLKQEIG